MKRLIIILLTIVPGVLFAQERYYTRTGHIDFYSHAPLEDITASNDQVAAFLIVETGEFTFAVLMKSFEFKKALMQEHFNENYVESDEFPRSNFKGTINNYDKALITTKGEHNVIVKGELTIHGVTKEVEAEGVLEVSKNEILATSTFKVKPTDYGIKIPAAVKNNIAEVIDVNVKATLIPYDR